MNPNILVWIYRSFIAIFSGILAMAVTGAIFGFIIGCGVLAYRFLVGK